MYDATMGEKKSLVALSQNSLSKEWEALFVSHNFELTLEERHFFARFLTLFSEYNQHTNLSAIRDEAEIIEKHFVDSLYGVIALSSPFDRQRDISSESPREKISWKLLDIGSGWGFPGIPLKIVLPELEVTLLDSIGKKVRAMNFFIEQLGLSHILAVQERAETLAKNPDYRGKYDFVVSRATAYITDILALAEPFLTPWGRIVLYKMPSESERQDMEKSIKRWWLILEAEFSYFLWGKERCLYCIRRRGSFFRWDYSI